MPQSKSALIDGFGEDTHALNFFGCLALLCWFRGYVCACLPHGSHRVRHGVLLFSLFFIICLCPHRINTSKSIPKIIHVTTNVCTKIHKLTDSNIHPMCACMLCVDEREASVFGAVLCCISC